MAQKRILFEYTRFRNKQPSSELSLAPSEENKWEYIAMMAGPEGSLYSGGIFFIEITFPQDYPFKEPKFKFITKIYNPSIMESGSVCCEVFLDGKPQFQVEDLLERIRMNLAKPMACCGQGFAQYGYEYDRYAEIAREWTQKYAM